MRIWRLWGCEQASWAALPPLLPMPMQLLLVAVPRRLLLACAALGRAAVWCVLARARVCLQRRFRARPMHLVLVSRQQPGRRLLQLLHCPRGRAWCPLPAPFPSLARHCRQRTRRRCRARPCGLRGPPLHRCRLACRVAAGTLAPPPPTPASSPPPRRLPLHLTAAAAWRRTATVAAIMMTSVTSWRTCSRATPRKRATPAPAPRHGPVRSAAAVLLPLVLLLPLLPLAQLV